MHAENLITRAMDTDRQHQLNSFLVDNQELESLNARLATFNLFRVLRIEKAEIRHSNVLAWLLTPDATHGLGATFLRRFLSRLLMENEDADVTLTPAQIELMNFNDVEVLREWQHIDIVARSHSNGWCLLIENKIGSKEKKGALAQYLQAVKADMPRAQVVPVLLTMEGEDPSDEGQEAGFIPLSHVQVLELAERIIEQNAARIPGGASVFLNHYLDTLRRLTMQDDELIDLCKTIYRKHHEAIDLIVEYGASSQVLDACEEAAPTLVDCEFVVRRRGLVWFLPRQMGDHQRAGSFSSWPFLPQPVAVMCWYQYGKRSGRLRLTLEVGPVSEPTLRIRLLKAIKKAGFSFGEKSAFKAGPKYTRILSMSHKLRTNEDGDVDDNPEYVKEIAKSLWKKFWDEGGKITGVLKDFDWDGKN